MLIASFRVHNEGMNNLRKLRIQRGLSVKQLADALGTSRGQVYQLEGEMRQLKPHWIKRIQSVLNCTADELLGSTVSGLADTPAPTYQPESLFVEVPAYDVSASAGDGAEVNGEQIKYMVRFRLDWLKKKTTASASKLKIISVQGDSMNPTLMDGDSVLLDMTQASPTKEGIYAIRYDHTLIIKRVQYNPTTKRVALVSDNKLYEPMHDIDPATLDIVGRAIWQSRNL